MLLKCISPSLPRAKKCPSQGSLQFFWGRNLMKKETQTLYQHQMWLVYLQNSTEVSVERRLVCSERSRLPAWVGWRQKWDCDHHQSRCWRHTPAPNDKLWQIQWLQLGKFPLCVQLPLWREEDTSQTYYLKMNVWSAGFLEENDQILPHNPQWPYKYNNLIDTRYWTGDASTNNNWMEAGRYFWCPPRRCLSM